MDMFYAVLRRYYRGIPFGEADKEHIHHKLIEKGLSKKKVLLLLYCINISIMLLILMVVRNQLRIDLFGLLLFAAFAVMGLRMLGYIKFIPFIKETLRNHDIARKRKYFNYLIKKFRAEAAKSKSFNGLKAHLEVLMKEYGFASVEIFIYPLDRKSPSYVYKDSSKSAPGQGVLLSFPLVSNEIPIGHVKMTKPIGNNRLLCLSELIEALTEVLGSP